MGDVNFALECISRIPQELGLEPVEYFDRLSRDPAALAELLPEPEAGCD